MVALWRTTRRRSSPICSSTSTACRICCSSWRGPRTSARGRRNRVVSPELAGAYAYCERLARTHYENFPVASRLLPARDAAARRRDLRVRAPRRRHGRRRRPSGRRSARRSRSPGARASIGAVARRRAAGRRRTPRCSSRCAIRSTTCRLPPCRCSTICSARSGRTSPSRAMRRGTTCWTTAGDRRTRSAGSCCASPGDDDAELDAASDAVCTALQLTNFWQDLADRLGEGPSCTSRLPIWQAAGREGARSGGTAA